MPRIIPANFATIDQGLDPIEVLIRDNFRLNIENWAKFRWAIHVGNNPAVLVPVRNKTINKDVKKAYIELAKSHYECISSLGSSFMAFQETRNPRNFLEFKKAVKDFYFHIGCILDNLARLIYIINDPNCDTARKSKNSNLLKRHWIDWGTLGSYSGYQKLRSKKQLKEIINIRNILTHSWSYPISSTNMGFTWPFAIRKNRDLLWPYFESNEMRKYYKKWVLINDSIQNDFDFAVQFQNEVFAKLTKDIIKFERNFNLRII